jgi:hypothetical protein
MSDDPTPSALERIADILTRHGVQFIVIGGQAEWILGSPHVTYDVDLCYRRDADNLARLAAALREIRPALRGAPPDLPLIIDQRPSSRWICSDGSSHLGSSTRSPPARKRTASAATIFV